MSVPDFGEFAARCQQQEVTLHPALAGLEIPKSDPGIPCYAPSDMLMAVATAGALLRQDAMLELADKPIGLDRKLSHSGLARILAGIINHSIEPLGQKDGVVDFPGRGNNADACLGADYKFIDTVYDVDRGAGQCQIIGDGEPLLLRKMVRGVRSALSLRRLGVNGIPYPAGSIFQIKLTSPPDAYISDPMPKGVESLDVSRVEELNFMRLSVFALSVAERKVHFKKRASTARSPYNRKRINDLRQRSIQSLAKAAQAAYEPVET